MSWSTQELADLAGTTLRTVRHYHDIGLLPVPPRGANGYKSYGVAHLTLLLRIRRLVDLGAPLSEIREMDLAGGGLGDADAYVDKLRELADETSSAIRRLQTINAQIAQELSALTNKDSDSSEPLSSADEDFLTVASRLVSEESMAAWNQVRTKTADHAALQEFGQLTEEMDLADVRHLPERLAAAVRHLQADIPELSAPRFASKRGRSFGGQAFHVALAELYNSTQLEVLARTGSILREHPADHG
ncbi:MerR family transcriptional regulator [Brevibacterium sp. 1718]|uniref:MerR family transcriptional regulator n=1 Tax=Brevibacterium sp. 1718 TaxID=3413510 RepID=UPI003DA98128